MRILGADLTTNRRRTSVKWQAFPEDVLPLWVAEMDAEPAPPVVAELRRIALDLPVEVGRDHDDVSVRTSPEFTALRERIAGAIYGDAAGTSRSTTVGE